METLILFLLSKGAKLWHENEMNFDELKFDELKNSDERWTFFVLLKQMNFSSIFE